MRLLFLDCAPFMGGAQESLWPLLRELRRLAEKQIVNLIYDGAPVYHLCDRSGRLLVDSKRLQFR